MKNIFYSLLFLLPLSAAAQTISGTVYDENRQTIPGASVYLDGTSTGTISDEEGKFTLSQNNIINTSLVVSYVGYETITVDKPFGKSKYEFHMTPKTTSLKEVVINADGFTRKEKLRAFREQFLGTTKAGRSCEILNEDDLNFHYDMKNNVLTATSDVPLHIRNSHLGYDVDFNLVSFYVNFTTRSLRQEHARSSFYGGTTIYREIPGNKETYARNRRKSYLGSPMQFFRNLVHNKWGKDDFELYKGNFMTNPSEHFTVVPDGLLFKVTLNPDSQVKSTHTLKEKRFFVTYNLMYDRKDQSKVQFETAQFSVDEFGNTSAPNFISFGGEISKRRAGDLLPMDYKP